MNHSNAFETDLDRNPANHAALTPLGFIERAAHVYPERTAVVHGARRYSWSGDLRALPAPRLGARAARHRHRRHGGGDAAQHAGNVSRRTSACRCWARCSTRSTPASTRDAIAFMLNHGEAKVLITDREFSPGRSARALAQVVHRPIVIDVDDAEYTGAGERLGETDYEALLAEGDPDYAWQPPGRRMGCDLAQLHLRHHRQSQGRGLSPPRRLPECGVQHRHLGHAAAFGLSVDAADVPLQRLVLPLDHGRQCRAPTSACAGSTRC